MAAGSYDILIEQGTTFSLVMTIKDSTGSVVDLTGYTFRGKVKKSLSDVAAVATFTCTKGSQSDPATKGKVTITLTPAQTSAIPLTVSGVYHTLTPMVYDIESETTGGEVTRWLQGVANISPEVTT